MNAFDDKNLSEEAAAQPGSPVSPTDPVNPASQANPVSSASPVNSAEQIPPSNPVNPAVQTPPAAERTSAEDLPAAQPTVQNPDGQAGRSDFSPASTTSEGTVPPQAFQPAIGGAQQAAQPPAGAAQVASYTPGPGSRPHPGYNFDPMTGRPVGQQTPPPASVPGMHAYAQNPSGAVVFSDPEPGKAEQVKSSGFKVFMIVLSVVLALAIVAGGFYFIGHGSVKNGVRNNSFSGSYTSPDLADRPSDKAEEGTAAYVYNQVVDSVVLIEVYSYDDPSSGAQASGVVYSEDGYIVTNDHIYEDVSNPQFLITFADGRRMDAQFVAGDQRTDLAVLKVEATGLQAATFGDSAQAMIGDDVITIGNPGGSDCAFSLTEGVISATDRWASNASNYSMRFIQIDAAINSGSSGGALVNMYGQVIGITSWKYVGSSYENMAFAIPTTTVRRVCDSLISNGYVAGRAKLGIKYQAVTAVNAKLNQLSSTGLLVAEVTAGTPIEKSGIAVGDLITHIDGTEITDPSVMLEVLEGLSPGDQVTLTVVKSSGSSADITAELIEDRGSSSYNAESGDNSSASRGGEFNFPDGD